MFGSYVALGDSFTEGLDDLRPDGTYRGWADLVAAELATAAPGFRYANLAVRGRRLAQVRDQQLDAALAMQPDLYTLAAGGNDILALRCDVDGLGRDLAEMVERLVATGAAVVVFTGFDARGRVPLGRPLAARTAQFNLSVAQSAGRLHARLVNLWALPGLSQDRMWARDRLHLSAAGHTLVARAVLAVLGLPVRLPVPDVWEGEEHLRWPAARRADALWVRSYLAPWVGRKLRRRSTGDGIDPKLPELTVLPPAAFADRD